MATKTPMITEARHAVNHFLFIYCVLKFAKVWYPTHNFFRTLWWKAWGHNPKENPDYHLSQINFDDAYFDRMAISVGIMNLAEAWYGKNRLNKSYAYCTFMMFSQHSYLKYAEYMAIYEMWSLKYPGAYIIDWFCKLDGIRQETLNYNRTVNPAIADALDRLDAIVMKTVGAE